MLNNGCRPATTLCVGVVLRSHLFLTIVVVRRRKFVLELYSETTMLNNCCRLATTRGVGAVCHQLTILNNGRHPGQQRMYGTTTFGSATTYGTTTCGG